MSIFGSINNGISEIEIKELFQKEELKKTDIVFLDSTGDGIIDYCQNLNKIDENSNQTDEQGN